MGVLGSCCNWYKSVFVLSKYPLKLRASRMALAKTMVSAIGLNGWVVGGGSIVTFIHVLVSVFVIVVFG